MSDQGRSSKDSALRVSSVSSVLLEILEPGTPGPMDSPMDPMKRAKLIVLPSAMVESWSIEVMPRMATLFASCRLRRNRDTRTAVTLMVRVRDEQERGRYATYTSVNAVMLLAPLSANPNI